MPQPFPWPRAITFVGLSLLMAAGPVHNQVLGFKYSHYVKPWRMYYSYGTALCEVTYVQTARDGQTRVLDRYALLDYPVWHEAPSEVRKLPSGPAIGRVGQQLCEVLPARDPMIHAEARCASVRGWGPPVVYSDLCGLSKEQIGALLPKEPK